MYKQIVGMPQGGIAFSELANVYLHYYESRITTTGDVIYRYIDDVISIKTDKNKSKVDFSHYPASLELIENIMLHSKVNYLNLTYDNSDYNNLDIDLCDKRLS